MNAIGLKGFEDVRVWWTGETPVAPPYGLKTHRSGGNAIRSLTIKVERASRECGADFGSRDKHPARASALERVMLEMFGLKV